MSWRSLTVYVVAASLAAAACAPDRPAPSLSPGDVWIQDVTLISPERPTPLAHAHVVVRAGRIVSIGTQSPGTAGDGVTVLGGAGKYLVPGLIDGHVHLAGVPGMTPEQEAAMPGLVEAYDAQLPRSYLYYGFTALVDLNIIDRARVDRLKAAQIAPAIFDCGNALSLANGYPMVYLPAAVRFNAYPNFLYDPRQAASIPGEFTPGDHAPEAAVSRVAAAGGVCIKAHYEPGFDPKVGRLPVPTPALMTAVRDAAHRHKLPLLLHANSLDAHRFAAEVQPDAVVHGMWNWGRDDGAAGDLPAAVATVLDDERKAGIGMMTTARVIGGLADLFAPAFLADAALPKVLPRELVSWYASHDGQWLAREVAQDAGAPSGREAAILNGIRAQGLRAAVHFARSGGRILFGSDTPSAPTYANPPGYNGYLELRELESAGLAPAQLLAAATLENAKLFNLAGYGTIEPGAIASLLLLRSDPLASVAAYDTIDTVIINGRVVPRERLAANQK